MGARLGIATTSLGAGLALDVLGGHVTVMEWRGFYATVAFTFLCTLAYGPFVRDWEYPRRFAALNIGLDMALVSALVLFSGASESIFLFLYMAVVIAAAGFFRRVQALAWGLGAGWALGLVLVAAQLGLWDGAGPQVSWRQLFTTWGVHTGALVLVSALTSFLATELARTGRVLEERNAALRRLRNLHERTVESLVSGLLTTDSGGRIMSFNAEAERICGCSREVAIGKDVEEILPGVRALAFESAAEARRGRARMVYRGGGESERHLGVGTYVLREAEGGASGSVMIFQDVTEVVQMERELRRSERLAAVGELSASIAHEIRNPLAAISGAVEVIQRRQEHTTDEDARLHDIVVREVDRLDSLLRDFLDFARPGPPKIQAVCLRDVLGEVLEMFDAALPSGLEIQLEVDDELVLAADTAQIRQVLWNLLLNGAQAMEGGGILRIEATAGFRPPQGDSTSGRSEAREGRVQAEIMVMDQGMGIAPEVAEQIFDPFFTTRTEGSGLGLATVHRIVEEHGGSIQLAAPRAGFATALRLRLPLAGDRV